MGPTFAAATSNVWVVLALLNLLSACTPRPLVRLVERKYPGCLYDVPTREKLVALSLDDGPDASTTPQLLQVLKDHDARATFFLIDDHIRGNDSLVTRMIRDGHEVGNHFAHKEASIGLNSIELLRSFLRTDSTLARFDSVRWVRPGSGRYDQRMLRMFAEHDYQCALGSVHPFDPQLPFAWYTSRVVLRQVYPGAIIVLHDEGYKGRNSVKALRKILPELARRGYRVVTIGELVRRRSVTE